MSSSKTKEQGPFFFLPRHGISWSCPSPYRYSNWRSTYNLISIKNIFQTTHHNISSGIESEEKKPHLIAGSTTYRLGIYKKRTETTESKEKRIFAILQRLRSSQFKLILTKDPQNGVDFFFVLWVLILKQYEHREVRHHKISFTDHIPLFTHIFPKSKA